MNAPADYDVDIRRIIQNLTSRLREIRSLDLTDKKVMVKIQDILSDFLDEAQEDLEELLTDAAIGGMQLADPEKKKLSALQKTLLAGVLLHTYEDVFAVKGNLERRVRNAIQTAKTYQLRAKMIQTSLAHREKREAKASKKELQKQVDKALAQALTDSAGRIWKPETYLKTMLTARVVNVFMESTVQTAIMKGGYYAYVSFNKRSIHRECTRHHFEIIKLIPEAPGDYLTYADLLKDHVFHRGCVHHLIPLDKLPEDPNQRFIT